MSNVLAEPNLFHEANSAAMQMLVPKIMLLDPIVNFPEEENSITA